jgi:hypothetical protein
MEATGMPQEPQIRALWIDAFSPGLKTPAEIDELVATAHAAQW